jgi:hypothetical protein
MVTMFVSFVVERAEQGVLDSVDAYADRELAHRFERTTPEGGEFVAVVRRNTDVLVEAADQLVRRQADVWAQALAEADRRRTEAENRQQDRLSAALETALERTLEAHGQRLTKLETQVVDQTSSLLEGLNRLATALRETGREQQQALTRLTHGLDKQIEALNHLRGGEQQLLRLQETLDRNLSALAGAGAFEEAVHSLTAAIHLLTARAGAGRSGPPRTGAAA